MPYSRSFAVEAHHSAATLYVLAPLSAEALRAAADFCHALPGAVRTLRTEASAAARADAGTLLALASLLRRWHSAREDEQGRRERQWRPGGGVLEGDARHCCGAA